MSATPSILILHASGTNRDAEAARACELAGGAPEIVHINQLRRGERMLAGYQALLLPGGFTYGDALGAGARLALDLQVYFHDQLHAFVDSGKPVLGICNGFQTLVKAGILPGARGGGHGATQAPLNTLDSVDLAQSETVSVSSRLASLHEISLRRVTLTENAGGRFECRWVHLAANRRAAAPFVAELDDLIFCPIAHGEGNIQVKDDAALADMDEGGLVAFRYVDAAGRPAGGTYPYNPNGSVADIAGLCNRRGNVVGLMPHPEDHILLIQNPLGGGGRLGLAIFAAMVRTV